MEHKATKQKALNYHRKKKGKIEISLKQKVKTRKDLSLAYTPGVAYASDAIAKDKKQDRLLTNKGNSVAIITDGTAVLGLGDIGPEAAIVILSALINALQVAKKDFRRVRVVISGAGAAGIATTHLLLDYGFKNITVLDRNGILYKRRRGMNKYKAEVAKLTNPKTRGGFKEALVGADVFIGVSRGNLVSEEMVRSMAPKQVIFVLANPVPEIDPGVAKKAGAFIVASGRSDYPNQVNNALVFPGLFKGLLEARASKVTVEIMLCAAACLARLVPKPTVDRIVPSVFDPRVAKTVAFTIKTSGLCRCKY